ncbi:MAG: LamG-like jellyroll fold domain-containing protein [Victivallales bacterium]
MMSPTRSRLLGGVFFALQFAFAQPLIQADMRTWETHCKELAKDSSVIRLYCFDKEGDSVKNMVQKGAGTLLIGAKEPYREYSGEMKDQEFPLWTSGRFAGKPALCFRSAKDSVSCSQFYNTGTDSMSLELWVRTGLNPGDKVQSILLSIGSGFGSGWFITSTFYDVGFRFGRTKDEGGDVSISIPKVLVGHVWHHFVVIAGKGVIKIYMDGELAGEKNYEGAFIQPPTPGGSFVQCPEEDRGGLKIGSIRTPLNNLKFDLDELSVYNRILTAEEVKKNYLDGKPEASPDEQKKEHLALLASQEISSKISIELPNEYCGYLPRGRKIPISVKIPESIASSLNGPLSVEAEMKDINDKAVFKIKGAIEKGVAGTAVDMVVPERCGLYWLDTRLKDSSGRVIKESRFPLAASVPVPPMSERPASSPIAAHGAIEIWPESIALGARCERDISVWRPKKKDGTYDWTYPDFYIDECLKRGMDMMYCEQPHSYDKAALDKVANGDASEWEAWFRPLVERYKGRVKYWEVCNEPNARGCTPEQYVALLKSAHRIIRELDPGSKIVGLCGVSDYPQWTEDVLSKGGGKYFDILAFHNYIGGSPISEWKKLRKIERVKGSMEKHLGKILPIWNTESGIHQNWRVNGKPLSDDELLAMYPRGRKVDGLTLVPADAVTMATEHVGACWQAQSLLLDCALGVQRYFILMGASRYYPAYRGPTNGSPSEKGMALAALSSFMGNMKECSLIPMESSSSTGSLVTTADGKRVAALFSDFPVTRCFKVKENSVYKGMDFIGNPLEFKSQGTALPVTFGMEPVYLFDVPADFAELPVLSIKEFPALVSPKSKVSGTVKISNLFPARLDGTLNLGSPGSKAVYESKVSIAPGASADVPFNLEAGPIKRGRHEIKASLTAGGKEIALSEREFSSEGVARPVPMVSKEIKLDADPSEWEGIQAELSDSSGNVVIGKPPVGYYEKNSWQGPKDLSFSIRTAWRKNDGVYFLLNVVDDKLKTVPPDKVGMCFLQDGLEFFFDGRQLKDQTPVYSFGAEQVLVLPSVEDAVKPCLFRNCSKFGESVNLEFAGKRTATGYIIEGRIRPRKEGSPFKLAPGVRFGMDFVVDDAADSEMTRRTQMALHGTASNHIDTSSFGRYQLVEAASVEIKTLLDTRSKTDNSASTWEFAKSILAKMPQAEAAKIKWELKDEAGSKVFHIKVDSSTQTHLWWAKSIPVTEGSSLSISLQLRAGISGSSQYSYANAGVFFLDGKGTWISYEGIGSQPTFADPQWGTVSKDVMVPPNAKKMGVRLDGVSKGVTGSADFQFKDIVVTEANENP